MILPHCGFKYVTALFYFLINEYLLRQHGVDPVYNLNTQLDSIHLNSYGFDRLVVGDMVSFIVLLSLLYYITRMIPFRSRIGRRWT